MNQSGFALIVTITMMVLLATLAMAILGLNQSKTREIGNLEPTAIARSNARLALNLAIAQLQSTMGPDQRVSAVAGIFDRTPQNPQITGVSNPHILGVWSTTQERNQPIIEMDRDGIHTDQRDPNNRRSYDHREDVLDWLVSYPQNQPFDPRNQALTPGENAVILGFHENEPILAPLVMSTDPDNPGNQGALAYHVTDLGASAPLSQVNVNAGQTPNLNTPEDGGFANLFVGNKRPYDRMSDTNQMFGSLADDQTLQDPALAGRILSRQSVALAAPGGDNTIPLFLRNNSLAYTDTNMALFTDTFRGGLRIDLSPYINTPGAPGSVSYSGANGVIFTDVDPMLEGRRFQVFSPKWGALRDHAQLANLVNSDGRMAPRPPIMGSGLEGEYPSIVDTTQQPVHPVIAEYSIYYAPVFDPTSPSNVSLNIYPRVTLWNPYNVTLEASDYFVQINNRVTMFIHTPDIPRNEQDQDLRTLPGITSARVEYSYGDPYWGDILARDGTLARPNYLFFNIAPVALAPGQAVVCTPAAPRQPLNNRDGNLGNNLLTASGDPRLFHSFHVPMGIRARVTQEGQDGSQIMAIPPIPENRFSYQFKFGRLSENSYHIGYQDSTSARLRLGGANTYGQARNNPIVHTLDINNWKRGNEGRWRDYNANFLPMQPAESSAGLARPVDRTKMGIRLKAFQETPANLGAVPNGFWNFPLFEMANMRAGIYRRHPWDWLQANPSTFHEFSYGPFAGEDMPQPDYDSNLMLPRMMGGVAETYPFLNSNLVTSTDLGVVLFDIPRPGIEFFNFSQFRSALLTQEFSAPTYIIGESQVPVTAPREATALDRRAYPTTWWNGLNEARVTDGSVCTWWDLIYNPARNHAAFDYRWEVNHALWDRFFLSTLDRNPNLQALNLPGAIPNRNITVLTETLGNLQPNNSTLPDRIAEHLGNQNHLSVNSINRNAWKALIASNMGLDMPTGGGGSANTTPFPAGSNIGNVAVGPTNSFDPGVLTGYRELTEPELDALVDALIEEVKSRAPFISISDFVNRRLGTARFRGSQGPDISGQRPNDRMSTAGPLEVAIRMANLNAGMQDLAVPPANQLVSPFEHQPQYETHQAPQERLANASGHLTQGKILNTIGSSITARSDTFLVRAYGEAKDASGQVIARAWCEAKVQRYPDYVDPRADQAHIPFDNLTSQQNIDNGRRFRVTSFRWIGAEEV